MGHRGNIDFGHQVTGHVRLKIRCRRTADQVAFACVSPSISKEVDWVSVRQLLDKRLLVQIEPARFAKDLNPVHVAFNWGLP